MDLAPRMELAAHIFYITNTNFEEAFFCLPLIYNNLDEKILIFFTISSIIRKMPQNKVKTLKTLFSS